MAGVGDTEPWLVSNSWNSDMSSSTRLGGLWGVPALGWWLGKATEVGRGELGAAELYLV